MHGQDDIFNQLKLEIASGGAICLVGSGFSLGAMDALGSPVMSTSDLTDAIKSVLDIPKSEMISLAEAADFAAENAKTRASLVTLLVTRLTSCSPTKSQIEFLNLPWRSIFTTNFDDIPEQAGRLDVVNVSPATNVGTVPPDKCPIYYMHGRALDVREKDVDPKIVISEENYLRLGQYNRDLYAKLFNEILCARKIIILGYSLRDLEIASGLFNLSSDVRDKTLIVTSDGDSDFSIRRLAKFGTVLPVGLDGFLEGYRTAPDADKSENSFQYLNPVIVSSTASENQSEDFLRLILRGDIELGHYLHQKTDPNQPYCVVRQDAIDSVVNSKVNRFLISSDFGNGKSAFLSQISVELISKGYRVYIVDSSLEEVHGEIEHALKQGGPVAFLIDDVLRYRKTAIFAGGRLHNQSLLVCTTRGDSDSRFDEIATKLGGAYRHIDLNALNESELIQWDVLLERWGYWEGRAGISPEQRLAFLRADCSSENRSIVLSLFRDTKIGKTIDQIVSFFVSQDNERLVAFAALLVSSLCQGHVSWSAVVNWLDIDEDKIRRDIRESEVSFLFSRGRNWTLFTSAQLADYILRAKFIEGDRDTLVEVYSTVILRTAESANDERLGGDARENLKELMKYRFLTRLFGKSENSDKLIGRVYKRLSSNMRIRDNPQFWLQYAMSRMEIGDLASAETYITTALSKAEGRGKDYSPFQILDQRARLYLMKNSEYGKKHNPLEIRTAIDDLVKLAQDGSYQVIYPMRSVPLVNVFLEIHVDDVTADLRKRIGVLIDLLKGMVSDLDKLPRSQKGETKQLKSALADAQLVLRNA